MIVLRTWVTISISAVILAGASDSQTTDPPRRAARLGYVGGAVSLTPATMKDATPAEVNRTFSTGDRFWSGADGRGELQTENADIRFGAQTSFVIQELSNQATLIGLESGTLSVRLHTLAPLEDFEIQTPQYTFRLTRLGAYRVNVSEKGDVTSVVRYGNAEIFGGNGVTTPVARAHQIRALAGGNPMLEPAPPIGPFEAWCVERDRREDLSGSAQYVSRDVPGYADLDERGTWRSADRYGMAWFPSNMDPDWAPYRSGHFVDVGMWGMTWVDSASWGFGPLHYGRWVKVSDSWAWIPAGAGKFAVAGAKEQFAVRPYYSPALVEWTKFKPGVVKPTGVVGWFPLGPGELWVPPFQATKEYAEHVNSGYAIDNAAKVDVARTHYAYEQSAMTAVEDHDFAAGKKVDASYVRVPPALTASAMVSAQPLVQVTLAARLGPGGAAVAAPVDIANRPVIVHRAPVPMTRPAILPNEPQAVVKTPVPVQSPQITKRTQPVQQQVPLPVRQPIAPAVQSDQITKRTQPVQHQASPPVTKATTPVPQTGQMTKRTQSVQPRTPPNKPPARAVAPKVNKPQPKAMPHPPNGMPKPQVPARPAPRPQPVRPPPPPPKRQP